MTKKSEEKELTPREVLFCQYRAVGKSKKDAAVQAGWSEGAAPGKACELSKNPKVKRHITELQQKSALMAQVTTADIIAQLAKIAFFRGQEMMEMADTKGHGDWSLEANAAIASVKTIRVFRENGDMEESTEVKRYDPMKALKMLGDYTGSFTDLNSALRSLQGYGIELGRVDGKMQVIEDANTKTTASITR